MIATRRNRNKELNTEQHLHAHDDDLDDGDKKFALIQRDQRAIGGLVVLLLLTVIGLDIW